MAFKIACILLALAVVTYGSPYRDGNQEVAGCRIQDGYGSLNQGGNGGWNQRSSSQVEQSVQPSSQNGGLSQAGTVEPGDQLGDKPGSFRVYPALQQAPNTFSYNAIIRHIAEKNRQYLTNIG